MGNTEGTPEPGDSVETNTPDIHLSKIQLQHDYDSAGGLRNLAKVYSVNYKTARKWLVAAGIEIRPRGQWKGAKRAPIHERFREANKTQLDRARDKLYRDGGRSGWVPDAELVLREALKRASMSFIAPCPVLNGRYIVDILLPTFNLVIEADGKNHSGPYWKSRDKIRENEISKFGYSIIRFTYQQIYDDADGCVLLLNLPSEDEPWYVEMSTGEALGKANHWVDSDIVRTAFDGKGAEASRNDLPG